MGSFLVWPEPYHAAASLPSCPLALGARAPQASPVIIDGMLKHHA
jgi:hypothetical protein